jgi:hypothetical protein
MAARRIFFFMGIICLGLALQYGCMGLEVAMLGAQAVSMTPDRTAGATGKDQQERIFSTEYEKTWKLAVQSMTELNIPILTSNKSDGLMVTDYVPIKEKAFGEKVLYKEFAERVETGRFKLIVAVASLEGGKTKVSVKPAIEKYVQYPHSSSLKPEWKPQESNGVIERAVFQAMTAKVQGEGGTVSATATPMPSGVTEKSMADFARFKGTWKGEMTEAGVGKYPVVLILNDLAQGSNCGSISYSIKDLKCGGSLSYIRAEGEKHILKEKIEYGKCFSGALIHLKKVDDKSVSGEWFIPSGKKACEGVFYLEAK